MRCAFRLRSGAHAHRGRSCGGRSVPRQVRPGMCGADAVAVGDRGQPLHVGADEPADHRGLRLAQLQELGGDVRHRAVVLAQLPPPRRRRGRGSVALGREGGGECLGRSTVRRAGDGLLHGGGAALLQPGELLLGDRPDGVGAAGGGHVAQGGEREVVVGVRERRAAGVGEVELRAGRPRWSRPRQPLLEPPGGHQGVEVPADGGRRDAQPAASSVAVCGPCSRIRALTRSRVRPSSAIADGRESPRWFPQHECVLFPGACKHGGARGGGWAEA